MSERPKTPTDEMKKAAAARIVAQLIKESHLARDEEEGAVRDLAKVGRRYMDGYEIMRDLERLSWDGNLYMANTLDGYAGELDNEIFAAQKRWFEAEQPTQPFPVGTRVTFRHGTDIATGVIGGVYPYGVAQFTIKLDGDAEADGPSQRRIIVDWENCTAAPERQP